MGPRRARSRGLKKDDDAGGDNFAEAALLPPPLKKRRPVVPSAKNAPLRLVDFARNEIYEDAPDRAVLKQDFDDG